MSNEPTTLSRRTMLGASVAVLGCATAVAVPALAEVNPDADLLRLDQEHEVAYARARALDVRDTIDRLDEDEINEIFEAVRDLEFSIRRIPAQALAGLAVKARLASVYFDPEPADPLMMGVFKSLVEDILRMANAAPKPSICERLHTVEA